MHCNYLWELASSTEQNRINSNSWSFFFFDLSKGNEKKKGLVQVFKLVFVCKLINVISKSYKINSSIFSRG